MMILLISVDLDFLQREPTEINNYVPGMKIHRDSGRFTVKSVLN